MSQRENLRTYLYPEKRGESVAKVLRELREETYPLPDKPVEAFVSAPSENQLNYPEKFEELKKRYDEHREGMRREVLALTAYFLEKIQPYIPPLGPVEEGVSIYTQFTHPPVDSDRKPHEQEVHHRKRIRGDEVRFDAAHPDARATLAEIEREYPSRLVDALYIKWRSHITTLDDASYEKRAFKRFESHAQSTRMLNAEGYILRGGVTGGVVSWNVLRAIPVAYFKKYNRAITPEEFRHIADTAAPLVGLLTRMHLGSLSMLQHYAYDRQTLNPDSTGLEFPCELFELTEDTDGTPMLHYDKASLRQFHAYQAGHGVEHRGKAYGCPAADAHVQTARGEQALTMALYDRYRELAERFLVPQLEAYTSAVMAPQAPKS